MERVAASSSLALQTTASNICRTKEICTGPDFFSGRRDLSSSKLVQVRRSCARSPGICAVERITSSSERSIDSQGGRWIVQPEHVLSRCPVDVERLVAESVHEILRNIQEEAPFLQYVFESKSKKRFDKPQRQKISKSFCESPNCWPSIRESLSEVDPDGVIMVQKLECERSGSSRLGGDDVVVCSSQGGCGDRGETNVWGVLVQGRGVHSHACYLLETTSMTSPAGRVTRYVLTRATCFGPSYSEQLENAWLL